MLHRCLLVTVVFIYSCSKSQISDAAENNTRVKVYDNVDERLWPYFASFEEEAESRGLSFDLDELRVIGDIDGIDEQGVAGVCQYGSHIDNTITIDDDFWNTASDLYREFVVYHELGHCVLFRGHDESSTNGICRSIMRSGAENCRDNYNTSSRTSYVDELFSEVNSGF